MVLSMIDQGNEAALAHIDGGMAKKDHHGAIFFAYMVSLA